MTLIQQTTRDYADGNRLVINGKRLFASGMNIPWTENAVFGNEAGDCDIDIGGFTRHIANIKRAGGNAVRWWLHTDASNCPKMTTDGKVTGLGSKTIANVRAALDVAHQHGVVVALCLFSADLLSTGDDGGKGIDYYMSFTLDGNHKFLTVPDRVDSYIENALDPMLAELGGHPAIMCWEVFHDPEGMLAEENWRHIKRNISFNDILRVTNRIAGAARRHPDNKKMITTGIKSFDYLLRDNPHGYYSDETLIKAGGDLDGWLDFYMPHYSPDQAADISPFRKNAAEFGADRPIVIGTFPSGDWEQGTGDWEKIKSNSKPSDIVSAYVHAYLGGYAGALSWSMVFTRNAYDATKPALLNLGGKYGDDIRINDFIPPDDNSAAAGQMPSVTVNGNVLSVTGGNGSVINIKLLNLRGSTVETFDVTGNSNIPLAKIPAGRYVAEIRSAGAWQSLPVVVNF